MSVAFASPHTSHVHHAPPMRHTSVIHTPLKLDSTAAGFTVKQSRRQPPFARNRRRAPAYRARRPTNRHAAFFIQRPHRPPRNLQFTHTHTFRPPFTIRFKPPAQSFAHRHRFRVFVVPLFTGRLRASTASYRQSSPPVTAAFTASFALALSRHLHPNLQSSPPVCPFTAQPRLPRPATPHRARHIVHVSIPAHARPSRFHATAGRRPRCPSPRRLPTPRATTNLLPAHVSLRPFPPIVPPYAQRAVNTTVA